MPVLRGSKLALVGAVGAALAWAFEVGVALRSYEIVRQALQLPIIRDLIREHAALLDWSVGAFVGVVAADLLGSLRARRTRRDVGFSSTLGVGKGTAAVAAGAVGLAYVDTLFAELVRHAPELGEFLRTYLGEAAVCFGVGIWVGAVVAEAARL